MTSWRSRATDYFQGPKFGSIIPVPCVTLGRVHWGGSHVIEALTDHIESSARALIAKVDDLGGVVQAIERGWIQKEILDTAYRYQKAVDSGDLEVVGVNVNEVGDEPRAEVMRLDPDSERRQVERVRALRARRDTAAALQAIDTLRVVARTEDNLMPHIVHAVRVRCTVGEIAGALRDVFGSHRETIVV